MSNDLKRTLDLKDSISVVAGSMIGCGIFIVSSDIARQVGSASLLLIVWSAAIIFSLSGAIAYIEPVLNIKEDGGQYIFLKKMYNETVAFLYGWSLLTVIQTATIAAVCLAVGKFTGIILPFIGSSTYIIDTAIFKLSTQQFFAMSLCVSLTYINSKGLQYGVLTQNILTATKILSIAGIIVFGIFFGCGAETIQANFTGVWQDLTTSEPGIIATATVGAIFAMVTWNNITFISSEIKSPERNIPLALFWGVMLVSVLYLLINMLYVFTVPIADIQNAPDDIAAVALMQKTAGAAGNLIIAIIIMISACGSANALVMTGARVYYKMAKDRLLFRSLAQINRRTKTPVNSLILQGIGACAYILFCGNYSELLDFVIYAALIFYILTSTGIFIYRLRQRKAVETTGTPLHKVNPIFGIFFTLSGSYIIFSITMHKFSNSIKTLIIILSGLPIYFLWKKLKQINPRAVIKPEEKQ